MKELPTQIYLAGQVRELDRLAIEEQQIPGYTLMSRAGQTLFNTLEKRWPDPRVLILCGAGNNAGDGYILARLCAAAGWHTNVVALFDPTGLKGDAALAYGRFCEAGGATVDWSPAVLGDVDVVVDAILGTGLSRPLSGPAKAVVDAVNASGVPVLAVDLPTGLNPDTGAVMGAAIVAQLTVTFVGLKFGLYLGLGPACAGEVVLDTLGIPASLSARVPFAARRIERALVRRTLPARRRDAHKGLFGHVLVVGGGPGMPGAARLAGEAALRVGAGRVTVATWPDNVAAIVAGRPELMCRAIPEADALVPLLALCDVVALGPGLGTDGWAEGLMRVVEASGLPVIADADALNMAAARPHTRNNWVYTPHPGEAARMLATTSREVQNDRCQALFVLLERYGGIALLKGAGTLVGRAGEVPWVCDRGNPGMASAGMGDVLTGVIAGIAAQCRDLFDAARAGVLVHSLAGDLAAANGARGILAGDLCARLREIIN